MKEEEFIRKDRVRIEQTIRYLLEEKGITEKVIDKVMEELSIYFPEDKLDMEFLNWLVKQEKNTLIALCIKEFSVDRKKWILMNGFE